MYVLPNISQTKGNQRIKFGQILDYNKRNISVENSFRRYGKETSLKALFDLFIKSKIKWSSL